jgi:polyhydroxybutyrate depolymerase
MMRVHQILPLLLLVSPAARAEDPLVKARPYFSRVPKGYDALHHPEKKHPLLLLLQPYYPGGGEQVVEGFKIAPILDENGILLAAPDGTLEGPGKNRFWNATDACCDFKGTGIDDVAYLTAVIADMRARFHVDEKRIFVTGFSNGGFMTRRLLCDRIKIFAAGVSMAGAGWNDPARCHPDGAAALLEIHGDADEIVRYDGGDIFSPPAPPGRHYPSAHDGMKAWAKAIGCGETVGGAPAIDLIDTLPGAETTVEKWTCARGAAELWTVHGAPHVGIGPPAIARAIRFLLDHPKP